MQDGKLQRKVALVTGASSGIGEATALALAAEGARVALAARRGERPATLVERIRSTGGEAVLVEPDVIRVTSIEPGAVKTEFVSHMREDVRDAV